MDETLLSSLCSICNTTKSKYRCPGCAARTCSLPCYKRHQQRALCTGKRDPTKYVKKSQLATPAGIDHDFNFITGIERKLEKAERDVNERGLGAASEVRDRPRKGQLKGQLSDRDFEAAGVKVIRAPKGLSRQRDNKTHRSGRGNIKWTVEWIREDKTRLLTDCTSAVPIYEVQPFPTAKKRKKPPNHLPTIESARSQDAPTLPPAKIRRVDFIAGHEKPEPTTPRRPSPVPEPVPDVSTAFAREPNSDVKVANNSRSSLHLNGPDPESLPPEYNFFLLRPQTSSSRLVLVPISTSATLGQCLRGRTVLEFPTIYAFPDSIAQLPEEFMLEEEYMEQEGEEQKEFDDLLKHAHPEILRALQEDNGDNGDEKAGDQLDSKKILDVLNQDLGGFV
ncbi:hypothetical protein K505DRAFT_83559 [Melanomma pulvis-pyrius CBS 109.77]|uniref:HIT-type domain-containing protein n=1 Tax=Melanomma pulvis-pyrius CBS 109.77 TaxID=1314802 RepID=A0A6A6X147_9PLEO|nr:hypothetical protein K505DRAFT_83559 [Melanomma pulvis-pyrius CBS 109.77]